MIRRVMTEAAESCSILLGGQAAAGPDGACAQKSPKPLPHRLATNRRDTLAKPLSETIVSKSGA